MEWSKISKKLFPVVIGLSIGVSVAMLVQHFFFNTPTYAQELKRAATEITKSCPVMVDAETRLDRVEVVGENTLRYLYTLVNMKKSAIDVDDLEEKLTPAIREEVKENPDMELNRKHNTTMMYTYQDQEKSFLFDITVTPEMYKE